MIRTSQLISLSHTQTEDIEERMNRAFDLYTEGPQDENYMEDVNDVVAYVQETVSYTYKLYNTYTIHTVEPL